jgi:hypothetical protein
VPPPPPPELQPQWLIPLFLCGWLAISAVVACAGGWFSLSKQFRSDDKAEGDHFRFASGSIGRWPFPVAGYNGCLFLTVNDSGFRLAIFFPFRFLSPPLFIRWSDVKSVQTGRFLFVRYTLVRLLRGWPTVAIRGKAGQCIADIYTRVSSAL